MRLFIPVTLICFSMIFACASEPFNSDTEAKPRIHDTERVFYGNIYGTIRDSITGAPIENACIKTTDLPVQYLIASETGSVVTNHGPVIIPDLSAGTCQAHSLADGSFLINNIPIYGSSRLSTLIIEANDRDALVIDQVLILPGASMALRIDCRMTNDGMTHIIKVLKGHTHADIYYRDELKPLPENNFH